MSSEVRLPADYLQIPDQLNIAACTVDRQVAAGHGDIVAMYLDDQRITYRQLQARVNQFGNALAKLGIGWGDHFIIRSPNCPEYIIAMLGGMKIGAVPIPSNSLFRTFELEHIINNSESVAVFTTTALLEAVLQVREKCPTLEHIILIENEDGEYQTFNQLVEGAATELEAAPTGKDDSAYMMYTSGTTGEPKGVEHAHRWIVGTGDTVARLLMQLQPGEVCFAPQEMSFMHAFGLNFLYPLYCGAGIVVYSGRFTPEVALEYLEKYRVNVFITVPTMLRMLLAEEGIEHKFDLSSVRMGISAGEPLPQDTYESFKARFGIEIFDGIGQTEIHIFVANRPGQKVKSGSMGTPFPGNPVTVLDDEGNEHPAGEVGELVIRADNPGLFKSYYKKPERQAAVIKGGWYYTQDLAYVDEDGYFWYVSRSDDLIKSRAYLISPKEVEAATMEHPAVFESGVVGLPDPVMGQKVVAYIALKEGRQPSAQLKEEILTTMKGVIAPYKVPKEIEFVSELPKTATGKIKRRDLRGQVQ